MIETFVYKFMIETFVYIIKIYPKFVDKKGNINFIKAD